MEKRSRLLRIWLWRVVISGCLSVGMLTVYQLGFGSGKDLLSLVSVKVSTDCKAARELGEMEPLPPVKLVVTVDKAADDWLKEHGESIAGSILFDGDGDPGHVCKTAPFREIILGEHEFELPNPGAMMLNSLSVSVRQRARLDDSNFHYTMNVVSTRRKYPGNALSCGSHSGRSSSIISGKHTIRIHCTKLKKV